MNLLNIFKALYKGRTLVHVVAWKNTQIVTSLLVAIATSILAFFPNITIDGESINNVCNGVALIGIGLIAYLTPATTTKVGIPNPDVFSDSVHIITPMPNSTNSVNSGAKGLRGE
jgi:hypothetical protein